MQSIRSSHTIKSTNEIKNMEKDVWMKPLRTDTLNKKSRLQDNNTKNIYQNSEQNRNKPICP
jgi:hypothetical protein